ncbi:hypothetical protein [Prosthecobacter sp.]|uniref:hypothetical protein n=1 Tax=Prosthecobacter sp. TaxID=1965333 RepID=UPI00378444DB
MKHRFLFLRLATFLRLCLVFGVVDCLAPVRAYAQQVPIEKEVPRKEQVREIEKYLGQIEEDDRPLKFLVYVVLGTLGVISCMIVLRRFLAN